MARPIHLPPEDRDALERWANDGGASLSLRARIVLLDADGRSADSTATELGVGRLTVYKWRRRYRAGGLESLHDRPRSGQPKKLSAHRKESLRLKSVHSIPRDAIGWTIRRLARATRVTDHQVRAIWSESNIDPRRIPNAIEDAVIILSCRPLPIGLVIAPPYAAALFEVGPSSAAPPGERETLMLLPRVKRRRHRSDGLFAACDVLDAHPPAPTLVGERLDAIVRAEAARARDDRQLHAAFSTWESRVQVGVDLLIDGPPGQVRSTTWNTLDAFITGVESIYTSIESSHHDEARTAVRLARAAVERFVHRMRELEVAGRDPRDEDRALVWRSNETRHSARLVRESGIFAKPDSHPIASSTQAER